MTQITPEFLEQLQSRVVLSQLIGARLQLKRRGKIWLGLCPFHNEKTPSFNVNDAQGSYHCFGCGAHGDAISFLRETEKLDFVEAVERLAQSVGISLPRVAPEDIKRTQKRTGLYEALEAAACFYEQQLYRPRGESALRYFQDRGLREQTLKTFRLGYAPEGGHLMKALTAAGFDRRILKDAGLIIAEDERREPLERFRDRVIFPIRDAKGRVVGFGGRLMGPGEPKYLNSPETEVFHKGLMVYGSDFLASARKDSHPIIVVEGYMDVISLHQAGYAGAVAPLGTALTPEQMLSLWRYHEVPILCFDGDAAGVKASHRAMTRLLPVLKPGHTIKVAMLPQGTDPDDLVRQGGAEALEPILAQAKSLIECLWQAETKGVDLATPEKRAAFERHLLQLADSIADPMVKRYYKEDLIARLKAHLRPSFTYQKGKQTGGARKSNASPQPPAHASMLPSPRAGHDALLALTLRHPEILEHEGERFAQMHFKDARAQRLQSELLSWSSSAMNLTRDAFEHYLLSRADGLAAHEAFEQYRGMAAEALALEMSPEDAQAAWFELYQQTHDKTSLEAELQCLQEEMAQNFTSELWSRIQTIKATLENLRSDVETVSFAHSDM
ncbi:MAG: DNA primase [Holosporales bacterium]